MDKNNESSGVNEGRGGRGSSPFDAEWLDRPLSAEEAFGSHKVEESKDDVEDLNNHSSNEVVGEYIEDSIEDSIEEAEGAKHNKLDEVHVEPYYVNNEKGAMPDWLDYLIYTLFGTLKRKIITILFFAIALSSVLLLVNKDNIYFKDTEVLVTGEVDSTKALAEEIEQIVTAMYDNEDISGVTAGNEMLVNILADNQIAKNDIRDLENFHKRYGVFSNKPTKVTITKTIEDLDKGEVFVMYTIYSDVTDPINRLVYAKYSDFLGKYEQFVEYDVY